MDKLFGTYTCPPKEPDNFGIKEDFPENYVGQMLKPMLPNVVWKRFSLPKTPGSDKMRLKTSKPDF